MEKITHEIQLDTIAGRPLPFVETLVVMGQEPTLVSNPNDDLSRELSFYQQALAAVEVARQKITSLGLPFTRPNDYFAEMVKSDEQMMRVFFLPLFLVLHLSIYVYLSTLSAALSPSAALPPSVPSYLKGPQTPARRGAVHQEI